VVESVDGRGCLSSDIAYDSYRGEESGDGLDTVHDNGVGEV
jgi:hypothetical protein